MMTFSTASMAADRVTFLTSWHAQAEHGDSYQALAKGIYQKAGLDVAIKTGSPQVNGMQLLTATPASGSVETIKAFARHGDASYFQCEAGTRRDAASGAGDLPVQHTICAHPKLI